MYRQLNTLRRHKWKLVICLGAARECSGVLLPHYLRLPFFRLMMEMHLNAFQRKSTYVCNCTWYIMHREICNFEEPFLESTQLGSKQVIVYVWNGQLAGTGLHCTIIILWNHFEVVISTEGVLRLPTAYDTHPNPIHPIPSHKASLIF